MLRVLTQRKVVDYLRARRGPALAAGAYTIEVIEGRSGVLVTPEKPDGIKLDIPAHPTLWGRVEFSLYVSSPGGRTQRVAIVGRAGTTIMDNLAELDEFTDPPWTTGQVGGQIIFESLLQSAGRRAVLRDRDAFPVFVDAVRSIESAVAKAVAKVAREVDEQTADRMADTLRRVFGRVLRELADLDNPMRTPIGVEPGGGLLNPINGRSTSPNGSTPGGPGDRERPDLPELDPLDPIDDQSPRSGGSGADRNRSAALPSVLADPDPGEARSRFDSVGGVVFYNDRHADYLLVKDDDTALLDYLATLVAKEYVLYNNARAGNDDFAEEMVRMLVRVRRHLPRRR